MINEEKKPGKSISRRHFVGSVMMASAGAALLTSCKSSSKWQIGCYTRPWTKHDYRVALDGMVEAGFKYVGLSTHDKGWVIARETTLEEAAVIGEEIKKRGLTVATVSGGYFAVDKTVEEGITLLKRAIDITHSYNCKNVQISNNTGGEVFNKIVSECCDYAADKGIRVVLKPHGAPGVECRKIVEAVGKKNLKIWYDPGNVYYYSEGQVNPVEDANYLDGLVAGVSVKDFQMPKNVSVTPGTGMVDFPKLIARLQEGGLKGGALVVEQTSAFGSEDRAYLIAEAKKARLYLENLISNL